MVKGGGGVTATFVTQWTMADLCYDREGAGDVRLPKNDNIVQLHKVPGMGGKKLKKKKKKTDPSYELGHAPLNITYFDVVFRHDVDHAPNQQMKTLLLVLYFFVCLRDMTPTWRPAKTQRASTTRVKKQTRQEGGISICVHAHALQSRRQK